jgi:hypothetical protein
MTNVYRAIAPRLWVSATDAPEGRPTCDVYEPDRSPVDTGIVDAHGVSIFRCQAPRVIGFAR